MNLKALNFKLLIAVLLICVASVTTIYAIIPQLDFQEYSGTGSHMSFVYKQIIGMSAGIVGVIIIFMVDLKQAKFLINLAYYILFAMLFILIANIPGTDFMVSSINGADGWFKIPIIGATIQPVEFMKIILFLKLAEVSKSHIESNKTDMDLFIKYAIYAGLPVLFVLLQPDLGGVILLFIPSYVLFLTSLKDRKNTIKILLTSVVLVVIGLFLIANPVTQEWIVDNTPLYSYQLSRINAWLYPFTESDGYQLQQSLILIGSAGAFGQGIGYSAISLPEPHTDVIFSEFVGMFGWLLGVVLIALYAFIIIEFLNIGARTKDLEFKFVSIGYAMLLVVQIFENIGMMIGLFPITGIVLPFMSYGVSALITYFAILGIMINIDSKK